MNGQLPDTWHDRDLPVLREAARVLENPDSFTGPRMQEIANATGLELKQVLLAAQALESDDLVMVTWLSPTSHARIERISGDARRAVGLWPTGQTALDRMIAALEAIATNTDEDEDTRTRARKVLDGLTGAGKTIGLAVATAAITGQLPHS